MRFVNLWCTLLWKKKNYHLQYRYWRKTTFACKFHFLRGLKDRWANALFPKKLSLCLSQTKCNRLNKQNKNSELAAGLFDRFLYHHHTTNVVKRHRSGNSAILAFISKIVVWLNGIVATSISSEIHLLSVTFTALLKNNRIKIWTKKTLHSPV